MGLKSFIGYIIIIILTGCATINPTTINPKDAIIINIYPQKELSRTVIVDRDGYIFFDFLGKVKVSGITYVEAESKLYRLLEDYLIDYKVYINKDLMK